MLAVEVYGQRFNQISWHKLPIGSTERILYLAEIKRLPLSDINSLNYQSVIKDFEKAKKLTHRSMIQIDSGNTHRFSFFILRNKTNTDFEEDCFYSFLVLEESEAVGNQCREKTLISGARWKKSEFEIEIAVSKNGKKILQNTVIPGFTKPIYLDNAIDIRPGDILEITLNNAGKTFDRISVNLGARKTA